MPSRPSAGGIKRNSHHRRNRRRNISTFSRSAGVNYPALEKNIKEVIDNELPATEPKYPGFNENIWIQSHRRHLLEVDRDTDWKPECFIATSGLDPQRFIHIGPFSKPEEIKRQRFGNNPNDNWWLWEIRELRSRKRRNEFLDPVEKHNKPLSYR